MYGKIQQHLQNELADIKESGLFKSERIIVSPQGAEIKIDNGQTVLNFCANNYLGLPPTPRSFRQPKTLWILTVSECHRYVLFVVRKIFTNNWKQK